MTVQELVDYCNENNISLDTQVALRAKDDYLLIEDRTYMDGAYFGNCSEGTAWQKENLPKDEDGYPDYENAPELLILSTGRG